MSLKYIPNVTEIIDLSPVTLTNIICNSDFFCKLNEVTGVIKTCYQDYSFNRSLVTQGDTDNCHLNFLAYTIFPMDPMVCLTFNRIFNEFNGIQNSIKISD